MTRPKMANLNLWNEGHCIILRGVCNISNGKDVDGYKHGIRLGGIQLDWVEAIEDLQEECSHASKNEPILGTLPG